MAVQRIGWFEYSLWTRTEGCTTSDAPIARTPGATPDPPQANLSAIVAGNLRSAFVQQRDI